MDEMKELNRIWDSLEAQLASMSGTVFRTYSIYIHGQDTGKTIEIESDRDSDDIINDLIDAKIIEVVDPDTGIEHEYHFETLDTGESDTIEISKVYDNEDIPEEDNVYVLKTNDEIEDFDEFLEHVLDIERTQYLSSGEWVTKEYTIVTGTGGPHVEFTTGYSIHVYWGGQVLEFTTYNDRARATIDRIEEYLNEIYGSE